MPRPAVIVGVVGLGILFVIEYLTQIGVGRYPVTTVLYASTIARTGHLTNLVHTSNVPSWENLEWIDSFLPLPSILVAELGLLVRLPVHAFANLPIGSFLLLPFFVLIVRLTKRPWFAVFAFFGYLIPAYGFLVIQQLNRASLGIDLFGYFLLVLFTQKRGDRSSIVCSTVLLIAIGFTYYTAASYAVAAALTLWGYSSLTRRFFPTTGSSFENSAPFVSVATVIVSIATFSQTSILYVIPLQFYHLSDPAQFLSSIYGIFSQNLLFTLGLAKQSAYAQLGNLPIPLGLHGLTSFQKLAIAVVVIPVIYWMVRAVIALLQRERSVLNLRGWEISGSLLAIAITVVGIVGYGPQRGVINFGTAGLIGIILLYPRFVKSTRRIRRVAAKGLWVLAIAIVLVGSAVSIFVSSEVGFVGVHPNDGSLYTPVSTWYGSFSTSNNVATGNVVLSSIIALHSRSGLAISTFAQQQNISMALRGHDAEALGVALAQTKANIYAFTAQDENRPSWGDVWGYVAPNMSYSSWFYDLHSTNIVYTNGLTTLDNFGGNS